MGKVLTINPSMFLVLLNPQLPYAVSIKILIAYMWTCVEVLISNSLLTEQKLGYICCHCCSVTKSCLTICDPRICSMPGSTVLNYILQFAQFMPIERTDAEAPIFWLPEADSTLWKRSLCWERLKAKGKGGGRGWDVLIASWTQWAWTEQTARDSSGQWSLACYRS